MNERDGESPIVLVEGFKRIVDEYGPNPTAEQYQRHLDALLRKHAAGTLDADVASRYKDFARDVARTLAARRPADVVAEITNAIAHDAPIGFQLRFARAARADAHPASGA